MWIWGELMKIQIYSYTNKGGQRTNEDYIDYSVNGDDGIFVLADGLGGHRNGETASAFAVQSLIQALSEMEDPDPEELRTAFLDTGSALLREQQSDSRNAGMKTTAVALIIRQNQAVWGHIGDSRLYHFSDGAIRSVTRDHSVSYKKYLGGEITYAGIRGDEDRSSLLGVLGNPEKCVPEVIQTPLELSDGDAFLLCSDGFWDYVCDEEMLIDLLKSETPREWADHMLLRHIRRAGPDYDNLSLIALFVGKGEHG